MRPAGASATLARMNTGGSDASDAPALGAHQLAPRLAALTSVTRSVRWPGKLACNARPCLACTAWVPPLVLFGPDGTVTTEEEDAALKAQEFPDFFRVEDLSLVEAKVAEEEHVVPEEVPLSTEPEEEPDLEASASQALAPPPQ